MFVKKTVYKVGVILSILCGISVYATSKCTPQKFTTLSKQKTLTLNVSKQAVFHRSNFAEPESLDPDTTEYNFDNNIVEDLFESLYYTDASGKSHLAAAKSLQIIKKSHGRYTYRFCLRENHWSNGKPVKASDFVYSYKRLVNPKTLGGGQAVNLLYPVLNVKAIVAGKKPLSSLGVRAIGDNILEITTTSFVPYYKELFSMVQFAPVYKPVVEKYGIEWTKPKHMVTNGPFKLVKWVPNERIVIQKSMTYWDEKNVHLYQVVFFPTVNAGSAQRSYEKGQYDLLIQGNITTPYVLKLSSSMKKQYRQFPFLAVMYYAVNIKKAPESNKNLRKAMYLSINHQPIIHDVLHDQYITAYSIIPPGTHNYVPKNKLPTMRLPYLEVKACNVKRVKRHHGYVWLKDISWKQSETLALCYLKKAGYTKKTVPTLTLYYNTSTHNKLIALNIASMLKTTIGMDIKLYNEEFKVYMQQKSRIDYIHEKSPIDLVRFGWSGSYNDPMTFLDILMIHTNNNPTGLDSKKYDRWIQQASLTRNIKRRARILAKAEQLQLDSYATFPMYYFTSKWMIKPYVKGFPKHMSVLANLPDKDISIDLKLKKKMS